MTYAATGIILRRRDSGEWDRVYTVLTREHGKFACVGKGTRRPLAKLAAHLEPYSVTELVLAHGRSMDRVTFARVMASGTRFASSWELIRQVAFIAECVDALTRDAHRDAGLYDFLCAAFSAIAEQRCADTSSCIIRCLSILGYAPELERCVGCRATVPPGIAAADPVRGGVLCLRCRARTGEVCMLRSEDRAQLASMAADFQCIPALPAVQAFARAQLLVHLPGPLRSFPELTGAWGVRMVTGS
ncbi:DNA repair protein RecO [Candidatus Uhrbacteria bacterium]|nr:DNA repair protein RecO [Candidatus Uhrbacteria bacterium]